MTASNNTRNIGHGQSSAATVSTSKKDTSNIKRTLQGVGYNSKGIYKAMDGRVMTPAYKKWHGMINRCYNAKKLERRKKYSLCTVSAEWHDFQNFAEWFYSQEYNDRGYQVDKDLLVKGNKIYSPESCCLVPLELNTLLTDSGSSRGELPIGVTFHKLHRLFRARVSMNNKVVCLGYFEDAESAAQSYKKAKETYVKEKALEWQGQIAPNVFEALMNWTLD